MHPVFDGALPVPRVAHGSSVGEWFQRAPGLPWRELTHTENFSDPSSVRRLGRLGGRLAVPASQRHGMPGGIVTGSLCRPILACSLPLCGRVFGLHAQLAGRGANPGARCTTPMRRQAPAHEGYTPQGKRLCWNPAPTGSDPGGETRTHPSMPRPQKPGPRELTPGPLHYCTILYYSSLR